MPTAWYLYRHLYRPIRICCEMSFALCMQLVNHGPGEGEQSQFDQPLVELPPNATEAQKAEVLRIAKETHEEVDGLTTPQHGGESPGAGGRVDASTIFKYVLGSLLIIGLVVGVAVSVCSCAKPAS